jgi:SAM-dependent methyltransferase
MPTSRPRSSRPVRPTIASFADRHFLYHRAVQCTESEIDFVDETYAALRKRKARLLREDFCGTFNTACEWVRRRPTNIAVGVDLDGATLDWGRAHNLPGLSAPQRKRLHLHQGNVLDPVPAALSRELGPFDAVLAMNFSFWCFKTRAVLRDYFRAVHKALADDGVFFLDFYGGADALKEMRERRKIARTRRGQEGHSSGPGAYNGPFMYIWNQETYNPITGDLVCHIDFTFPDGSAMRPAYSYEWRLWTLPEVREILIDAGFAKTTVYWEGDDGKGGGDGNFVATEVGDAGAAFICYITAEK